MRSEFAGVFVIRDERSTSRGGGETGLPCSVVVVCVFCTKTCTRNGCLSLQTGVAVSNVE